MICRPATASEIDFSITLIETDDIVSESDTEQLTTGDATFARSTDSATDNAFVVQVNYAVDNLKQADMMQISVGENGTVAGNKVSRAADGADRIKVSTPWLSKSVDVTFLRQGGQTTDRLVNFVAGSLARECADEVDTRITAGGSTPVFSSYSWNSWTRSSSCYLSDIDFTCSPAWCLSPGQNAADGYLNTATAISPRHVIYASHWLHAVGKVFYFVTNDNQVVTRTLTDTEVLPGDWTSADTAVGLLDSDLPESITFAKTMPATLRDYASQIQFGFPLVRFTQGKRAVVEEWAFDNFIASTETQKLGWIKPKVESRIPYYQGTIAGDSASPVFAIVNGEAILVSHVSGLGSGPGYYSFLDDINAAMTTLGGGYQLTIADLSAYTDFSA